MGYRPGPRCYARSAAWPREIVLDFDPRRRHCSGVKHNESFCIARVHAALADIRAGRSRGETIVPDTLALRGVFLSRVATCDVVSLVSRNTFVRTHPRLTSESAGEEAEEERRWVSEFLAPYIEAQARGDIAVGVYLFDSGDRISVDVNVLVGAQHRENTLAFARANGQESIWSGEESRCIPTGGDGLSRLAEPSEVLEAATLLRLGVDCTYLLFQPGVLA